MVARSGSSTRHWFTVGGGAGADKFRRGVARGVPSYTPIFPEAPRDALRPLALVQRQEINPTPRRAGRPRMPAATPDASQAGGACWNGNLFGRLQLPGRFEPIFQPVQLRAGAVRWRLVAAVLPWPDRGRRRAPTNVHVAECRTEATRTSVMLAP